MGTINPATVSDGETIDAADLNSPIQTIADEINGNLDNNNIAAAAAIVGSKLAGGADGMFSEWADYTPTLTNFSGTVDAARYVAVGKTTFVHVEITLDAAATGALIISLPSTARSLNSTYNYFGSSAFLDDSASTLYPGGVRYNTSTTAVLTVHNIASGSFVRNSNSSATVPFTFASGDVVTANFYYEAD